MLTLRKSFIKVGKSN